MKTFSQLGATAAVVVALVGLRQFNFADDAAVAPADETQLAVAPQAAVIAQAATTAVPPDDGKLRIICFGAHPDDAEYKNGGTAAKWAKLGHHVKLVSVTNGDIGHWNMAGGALAQRRTAEVKRAGKILGVTTEVLDIHDGELEPTLAYRRKITRLIRNWQADIVIAHRPWDYHPDHRYVGVLVQDAAFMVTVPYFCPDTPTLKRNPIFLYSSDRFQKPYPFQADIAVAVDDVFEQKIDAVSELVSQAYEGGAGGSEERLSRVPPEADTKGRRAWLKARWMRRQSSEATKYREALIRWYGEERGRGFKYAEAFEICEYGRQPNNEELRKLFPFFD
ncbi:MAG: PIG-L family deacetylase [Planctomycetaceae bacterium]|jgi:N-acetylglucosamine malate deacetylase 1|nr:PIG-L family deacetylase [Planctomycetaceae bacterium]MBT6484857.1 PIG-L family deacetylase [Planctomycetaceae bacterium]MBT6497671.1 PIG-L family deacetylase [Planctomycetaceae bacterium]